MSSLTFSDISLNNTKMLEEQWQEMQQRYEKEQQLLAWLEEAVEAHHVEHVAQKSQKEAKAKVREKAEKRRIVEKEKKKKKLEYI